VSRMRHLKRSVATFGVTALVGSLFIGAAGPAGAHDEAALHPAHIHTGNCAAIGDVVFPLADVGAVAEEAAGMVGQASAIPVDVSVTTIEVALADVLAGEHVIVVHESAENIGNYVACGDIGGAMMGDTDLPLGLGELNDSGMSGVALLHDNGAGATEVSIFLTKNVTQPDDGAMAASEVPVKIEGFAYSPPMLEITVGATVTWTNMDSAPHTVSQTGGFESGKFDMGGTFSFTFDTPGTYEYFCQFHPNMKATIVVS
jgi:plastocyanin